MTIPDEELLVSRPPQSSSRLAPPQSIRIECQAEERHFTHSPPSKINGSSKPVRFTSNEQVKPGQYRSEIIVHNNPNVDFYIKRLHIAFHAHDDLAIKRPRPTSSSVSRSHSAHGQSRQQPSKYRAMSLPRSNSQAALHRWIDDICSNEALMANDDICFFIKNGEFLARI